MGIKGEKWKKIKLGNIVNEKVISALYKAGHQAYEISEIMEIPESVVRFKLHKMGLM